MNRLRVLIKIFWNAMAVIGVLSSISGIYGIYWVTSSYDLTPHQLALKAATKLGMDTPLIKKALSPEPRFEKTPFRGRLKRGHPQTILIDALRIEKVRLRYSSDKKFQKRVDLIAQKNDPIYGAVAWICGENREAGKKAIDSLVRSKLTPTNVQGSYGNGFDIALAYDLLANHPDWTVEKRQRINMLLRQSLRDALVVLDGNSASLWHGRFRLACSAWVVAAALDVDWDKDKELLSRVQGHFLEAVSAIELSGGWPEGYTYWINTRAFQFVLACHAHLNCVDAPEINRAILNILNRIGAWTIYGTEPTGRFVLFGDTGPRNDLKDETQRVIDLIALATANPVYRDYSRYLCGLHGRAGYYRAYLWGVPLFRGLPAFDFQREEALNDLSILDGRLKTSAVFGRNAFGQVFIHSDWGPDSTFISYRAGHTFAHHGHYQAGHFTITKKTPLAITSGTYGGYTSSHRLNYYIRTVAANSLLILRPGEKVKPNKFFTENVSDGGQRIVMPTGSAIVSVKDWESNLYKGRHYEGGKITGFENNDPGFVYVGSDLTGAYNNTEYDDNGKSGKVSKVTRQLVYLNDEDLLIVYDRVAATDKSYTKKWLLHSWSKPKTINEKVLLGKSIDGILETTDNELSIQNEEGKLRIIKLLPEDGVIRKVGGPNYRYYVEVDGDDSDLDGVNMDQGEKEQPWFDAGLWRLEIQPDTGRKFDQFLVLLKPEIVGHEEPLEYQKITGNNVVGAKTNQTIVLFGSKGMVDESIDYVVPGRGKCFHILVDIPPNKNAVVKTWKEKISVKTSKEGVLTFEADPGPDGMVHVDF